MLTPQFNIDQDDKYIYITVKAPMAKIKETQIDIDGSVFLFYSKPYYLRLNLPGQLSAQNGSEKIDWIAEENKFIITVTKATEGEHFEGLDMLTKLLTKPKYEKQNCFKGPEILNQSTFDETNEIPEKDEEDYDWHIEQTEWTEDDQKSLLGENYGFANKYTGVLARMEDELWDLLDIKQPETKTNQERKELRAQTDKESFDENHYWFDLYEQKDIMESLIEFKADWELISKEDIKLTDDEIFKFKNLPKREYLLSRRQKFQLLLGLVDILYAYAYDVRTTDGEHSCESGWTIVKLSSTLSWLETFSTLPEVVATCVQRSLTYPLYRNWSLSVKIISDVNRILEKGRTYIIKCLLDIHKIFNESGDLRYIFNDLYITDYCIWLQTVKEKTFTSLADALKKVEISKRTFDIDLELLEKAALLAIQEDKANQSLENFQQIQSSINNLTISNEDDDDDHTV